MNGTDTGGGGGGATLQRRPCDTWEYRHKRFLLTQLNFTRQFSHLYNARMSTVLQPSADLATERWPGVPHLRIVNLTGRCFLIGALYKNMASKPNFLSQYSNEIENGFDLDKEEVFAASAEDTLSLEDQSGRVKLAGKIPVNNLATGVIITVLGTVEKDTFIVEDYIYPPVAPQRPLAASGTPSYVAFVSGLNFGGITPLQELQLDALSSFLRGCMGCEDVVSNVSKLVVAGGLIAATADLQIQEKIKLEMSDHAELSKAASVSPMKLLDEWAAQVAESLPIDIMPGRTEPTNPFLPYQPLHPCMTPKTRSLGNATHLPSPCEFGFEGVTAIGTSGENLHELLTYTLDTPVEDLLELMLRSRLLAPTAPDTLYCYPYKTADPMQLTETPHLLFAGNSPSFASKLVDSGNGVATRVLGIPKFCETPGVVLVDFGSPTLETHFVEIATGQEG